MPALRDEQPAIVKGRAVKELGMDCAGSVELTDLGGQDVISLVAASVTRASS